jgi:hypothetical protein
MQDVDAALSSLPDITRNVTFYGDWVRDPSRARGAA